MPGIYVRSQERADAEARTWLHLAAHHAIKVNCCMCGPDGRSELERQHDCALADNYARTHYEDHPDFK